MVLKSNLFKDVDERLKSFGLDKDERGLGLTGDDLVQKQSSFITQMAKNMNMSVDAWVKMYQPQPSHKEIKDE